MDESSTLLLDSRYLPVSIISWTRAISLLWLGKVEVVESYDKVVRSPSLAIQMPAVVRLIRRLVAPKPRLRFSRQNIYLRDNGACQYCRRKLPVEECTFDHVIPRVRGGKTCWTNVVLCCTNCNCKKGGRTPEEASMQLRRSPRVPHDIPYVIFKLRQVPQVPIEWRDYLASLTYWTATLVTG